MTSDSKPGQVDFELCLLGLSWLRRAEPARLARYGNTVVGALMKVGVYSREEWREITSYHAELIAWTLNNAEILRTDQRPSRREILARAADSDQYLIVVVRPSKAAFFGDRLFGRNSGRTSRYELIITSRGLAYATSVSGAYNDRVTVEQFGIGWNRYVRESMIPNVQANKAGAAGQPSTSIQPTLTGERGLVFQPAWMPMAEYRFTDQELDATDWR